MRIFPLRRDMSTVAPDPTMEFLKRLEDPSLWKIQRQVPVGIPHRRQAPDPKNPNGPPLSIEITEADFPSIIQHLQQREQLFGVVPVLTIGHRVQNDLKFNERNQPDIIGYARDYEIGTFGPVGIPAILITEYVKPDEETEASKYPFRSMDFYPGTKMCTGVALLKRDPFLPMGMVTY